MSHEDAQRLLDYTQTAGLQARVHLLGNGRDYVVILDGCWFIWNFADWSAYHKAYKKDQARRRQEAKSA